MAFHDISIRFRVFTAAVTQTVGPQADCSRVRSNAEPSGTDWEANPREPEWQGQWRLLKYF